MTNGDKYEELLNIVEWNPAIPIAALQQKAYEEGAHMYLVYLWGKGACEYGWDACYGRCCGLTSLSDLECLPARLGCKSPIWASLVLTTAVFEGAQARDHARLAGCVCQLHRCRRDEQNVDVDADAGRYQSDAMTRGGCMIDPRKILSARGSETTGGRGREEYVSVTLLLCCKMGLNGT